MSDRKTTPDRAPQRPSQESVSDLIGVRLTGALFAVFVFSALFNFLILATPLFTIQLYSRVLTSQKLETLFVLTATALVAIAFASYFDIIRQSVMQRLSHRVYVKLGEAVVRTCLTTMAAAPNRNAPLMDVEAIRRFLGSRDITSMMDVPFTLLFIGILFAIHPILGGFTLAVALVILALAFLNDAITSGSQRRAADLSRQTSEQFASFSQKSPMVVALGMTGTVTDRWLRTQLETADMMRQAEGRTIIISAVSRMLRYGLQLAVMALAAYLVLTDDVNPGMIIAASILGTRAIQPVEGLISGQRQYRAARDAFSRIRGLLNSVPRVSVSERVPQIGKLDVAGLVFTPTAGRPMQPVVRGATFSAQPGEVVAIVGPSSAGKSVLGQLLVGALEPTAGSVKIDDIDLKTSDREAVGAVIGYLPQQADVLPGSVGENVARFRSVEADRIWDALRAFGVDGDVGRLPQRLDTPMSRAAMELSAGTYKRLMLARAFFGGPRLIVLDEPSSDLDLDGEKLLVQRIAERRETGATIVLVSPRGQLQNSADRVMVMKQGILEPAQQRGEGPQRPQAQPQPQRGQPMAPTIRLLAE